MLKMSTLENRPCLTLDCKKALVSTVMGYFYHPCAFSHCNR